MPTPYRPPGARKLKYDQPAYLITTDLITSAQSLIQSYLDRWEIEVLHRELKSQVGLGQAQVWSDKSVPRLHPALVSAYALLTPPSSRFGSPSPREAPRWGPPSSGNFRRRLMLLESGPEDGAGLPGRSRRDDADQS